MPSLYSKFLSKLRSIFSLTGTRLTYGILKPCWRCVYQRSNEPILIYSEFRGPRIIVRKEGHTFVRGKDCVGFEICGRCFEQCIMNDPSLPCEWAKLQ
jgi:hypothetical protein